MKEAKHYSKRGWWDYYRTEDGHTFSVRDNRHYFYHGNVFNDEGTTIFIEPKDHKQLFEKIKFVR